LPRIAAASSDGKVINRHFGRTERFFVLDMDGEDMHFVEERSVQPLCNNFEHSNEAMQNVIERLSDCDGVFAAKVGSGAANALFAAGIRVFEATGVISDVLREAARNGVFDEAL
jgi:predicted Fe-Mo cluster-binding NifX family protein